MKNKPDPRIPDVIFCAEASRRLVHLADKAGMLWGARLPMLSSKLFASLYFADQDWKNPNRLAYMKALEQFRPRLATVLDWEREEQFDEVMSWAAEAAQWVETVIVVPKVPGAVERIPEAVSGVPVRLGYSVPSPYGATPVLPEEFGARPVHLLGGSPQMQMQLAHLYMNVVSVDCNSIIAMAKRGQVWVPGFARRTQSRFGPQLSDLGIARNAGGFYLAFELSCHTVVDAWRRLYTEPGWYETMHYHWTPWLPTKGRPSTMDRRRPRQLRLPLRFAPRMQPLRQWEVGEPMPLRELRFRQIADSPLRWAKAPDGVYVVLGPGPARGFAGIEGCRVVLAAEALDAFRELVALPRRAFRRLIPVSGRTFTALRRWRVLAPKVSEQAGSRIYAIGDGTNSRCTVVVTGEGSRWTAVPGSRCLFVGGDDLQRAAQRLLTMPESESGLPGITRLRRRFGLRMLPVSP